jgi:hypothetical protein
MKPKELKNIAPLLFKIKNKDTGFTVPNAYFNEVENEIENIIITEFLPKETGLKIPDNYFENFENKLMLQLETDNKEVPKNYFENIEDRVFAKLERENKQRNSFKKYWIVSAIAASLVLFISIYNPFNEKNKLDLVEIEAYIEEGNIDINSYELADLYELELADLQIEKQINTDELEDYLEDELPESVFYN